MCCIFTCCGWMVDLIQRAWVFAMSCCISSAVCCVLMTSSMSGVALGYNYSLAEYIELKETNVSIYLKRGIFDDDVTDDMGFRRSGGHKAVRGYLKDEQNQMLTAPPEDSEADKAVLSGRRKLDDSIMESNNNNKFEGSLMKLTARPAYPITTTQPFTSDPKITQVLNQFSEGSLDQLKAIQMLINERKIQAARDNSDFGTMQSPSTPSRTTSDEHYQRHFSALPDPARRMMGVDPGYDFNPSGVNPAVFAVPDNTINEPAKWRLPKTYAQNPNLRKNMDYAFGTPPTYPHPIILHTGPIRPTRVSSAMPTNTASQGPMMKAIEEGVNLLEQNMEEPKETIIDKYETARRKTEKPTMFDYYEDDIKGLPVRKRRSLDQSNRRFSPKMLQEQLQPENAFSKQEYNNIPNFLRNFPSILASKLFFSKEVTSKSAVNDIIPSTDRIVKLLQSTF